MFRIDRTRVNIKAGGNEPGPQHGLTEITVSAETVKNDLAQKAAELPYRVSEDMAGNIIAEAQKEAGRLRAAAEKDRREAGNLLRDAKKEAGRLLQSSKELGYEEGWKRAQLELSELKERNEESLRRLFAEVRDKSAQAFGDIEADVIDLCFAIIRKIANLDRTKDGELFKATIKKTLKTMDLSGGFSIRLNAEDCGRFFPEGEYVFDMGNGQLTAAIVPDEELPGGAIILDTENESITAGIESQLKCIEIAFRQQLGKKDE